MDLFYIFITYIYIKYLFIGIYSLRVLFKAQPCNVFITNKLTNQKRADIFWLISMN